MTEPESPQSPQSNSAVDSIQLIESLRSLLPLGKGKIDLTAAEDVGRKVNRLAINFPNEQDEAIAFQSFALIGLAIAKGSKEAAKRKPRPARWLNDAPPSLQVLLNDDERHAAIKLLAPSKPSWVVWYAMREAADAQTSKELSNDLVKWATAASATQADLIKGLSNVIRAHQTTSIERIKQVLKLGPAPAKGAPAVGEAALRNEIAAGAQIDQAVAGRALDALQAVIVTSMKRAA